MRKFSVWFLALCLMVGVLAGAVQAKELTFGYIAPGPDTWYRRTVEGFEWACQQLGIKTIVLNSQYDASLAFRYLEPLLLDLASSFF